MDFETERFLTPSANEVEYTQEVQLRPRTFSEFVGQAKIKENVEIMVQSAKKRNQAMDHILLSGPPGLGKTSLAMIIASSLGSELHTISGPALEKKGDLAAILTNIKPHDVLFIDEIHRMHISIEEILYSAMEDFRLDIIIGQGPAARTIQLDIAPFTLVGATTRSGLLSSPLRDRFLGVLHFEFYKPEDLAKILRANSKKLELDIEPKALVHLSKCARGTPRIANRILRRVRDYCIVKEIEDIADNEIQAALELMEIDHRGLDNMDRQILKIIDTHYSGGPVGIDALCATLGEDRGTIEDVYEPFLLKEGFLVRTPRGRVISDMAKDHITN